VRGADGPSIETCRVVWAPDPVRVTADEALAPRAADRDGEASATDEAAAFVAEFLGEDWRPALSLINAAREAGISETTLKRARRRLRCQTARSGVTGAWLVALPGVERPEGQEGPQCPEGQP
jgi:hypothetical protein